MKSDTRLRRALHETQKIFPFKDYIGMSTYVAMQAITGQLEKFLTGFERRRLLDIGSGPMDKTGIFRMLGFNCCAVDDLNDPWHIRDDNTARIKRFAEQIGIDFWHQRSGKNDIPFEEASFDVVCSLSVIEHLHESPRELLNAMGRFARSGGLLVVAMPNSVSLIKRMLVISGRTNYPPVDMFFKCIGTWRGHVREYTLKEAEYICAAAGFEILSGSTFEDLAPAKLGILTRKLYILLGNMVPTLRSSLLVVCRKPKLWKTVNEDSEAYRRSLARGVPRGVA